MILTKLSVNHNLRSLDVYTQMCRNTQVDNITENYVPGSTGTKTAPNHQQQKEQ